MTLLDIRNQIVGILCEKPTFTAEDFATINVSNEFNENKAGLIYAALDELSEMGMIKAIVSGENPLWILSNPMGISGQQLQISMNTANNIADIINTYLGANDISGDRADALRIEERDIVMLLGILGDILNIDPDNLEENKS